MHDNDNGNPNHHATDTTPLRLVHKNHRRSRHVRRVPQAQFHRSAMLLMAHLHG